MTLFDHYKDDYDLMIDYVTLHLTTGGHTVMTNLFALVPRCKEIFLRPASSGGKYHNRKWGMPSTAMHTLIMLQAAVKAGGLMGESFKCGRGRDCLLLGILFHDALKYGLDPEKRGHTATDHHLLMTNFLNDHRDLVTAHMELNHFYMIRDIVRYHNGRYPNNPTALRDMPLVAFYVHVLDMEAAYDISKDFGDTT